MARVCPKRDRLPSCLLIENAPGPPRPCSAPSPVTPRHFRSRLTTIRELSSQRPLNGMAMQIPTKEVGLFIPSRHRLLRFAGPIENHVELPRHRTWVALNHQEPFAIRRDIVGVRKEIVRTVKQPP